MSPSMPTTSTQNITSLIEKIDQHPLNMPAMSRIGYAVGLVRIALQDGYAGDEFKNAILRYVATLRRNISNAETSEIAQKLYHRELLCGDMLCALTELEQNAKDINVNEGVVIDTDDAVHKDVEIVVDNYLVVDEYNLDHEFDVIKESDAEMSQADSAEWELVSGMSDYM